jgi:tRNA pseudouridine38-40 synthase
MTGSTIPPDAMCKAFNSVLPQDISIISSEMVPDEFHARRSARGKRYEYLMLNRGCRSPFYKDRAYFYRRNVDLGKIKKAAVSFLGTHDFTGFMSSGSSVEDHVRTIYESKVKRDGDLIRISLYGNGFLYNMVRIICGTLLYAGIGKIEPADMEQIISSCDRKNAGPTLPACGLYLKEVIY